MNPNAFKYCGPRLKDCRGDERRVIEPFRGDDLLFFVIPEIFSRESTSSVIPEIQAGIHVFAFSLVFKYCGPLIEAFRGRLKTA